MLVSGVYRLLSSGTVGAEHPHHPTRRHRPSDDILALRGHRFDTAGWKLASAYAAARGAEPALTNKHKGFEGCLVGGPQVVQLGWWLGQVA